MMILFGYYWESAVNDGDVGVLVTIVGMANESKGIDEVGEGD